MVAAMPLPSISVAVGCCFISSSPITARQRTRRGSTVSLTTKVCLCLLSLAETPLLAPPGASLVLALALVVVVVRWKDALLPATALSLACFCVAMGLGIWFFMDVTLT